MYRVIDFEYNSLKLKEIQRYITITPTMKKETSLEDGSRKVTSENFKIKDCSFDDFQQSEFQK